MSKDRTVLRITGVKERHIGCYVLTADNGVGFWQRKVQRGYLNFEIPVGATVPPLDHVKRLQNMEFQLDTLSKNVAKLLQNQEQILQLLQNQETCQTPQL